MNKSIFSLADVLTVLSAVAFGFVCFLGSNFYTLGDTKKSLILAVIITILLGGLAFLAKFLKRVQGNFKTSFILEVVVLILFTGLMIYFTYSPFSHYFAVSDKKEEIQDQLSNNITQAQNMFTDYEGYANTRMSVYYSTLNSVIELKNPDEYSIYGFEDKEVSDETQIKNKMLYIHSDLFPSNYSDTTSNNGIKQIATEWLADGQKKVTDWTPIGLVGVVNDIEDKSLGWQNDLVGYSSIKETGEDRSLYSSTLSFNDVKANFTTLGKPTPLSIVLGIITWVLMLLSWFITKRSSKVFRGLAKYEVEL